MNAARRTENTTVKLRLQMTTKADAELFVIIADTDRYSLAERKAAQVVIDVRERKALALSKRAEHCTGCDRPQWRCNCLAMPGEVAASKREG